MSIMYAALIWFTLPLSCEYVLRLSISFGQICRYDSKSKAPLFLHFWYEMIRIVSVVFDNFWHHSARFDTIKEIPTIESVLRCWKRMNRKKLRTKSETVQNAHIRLNSTVRLSNPAAVVSLPKYAFSRRLLPDDLWPHWCPQDTTRPDGFVTRRKRHSTWRKAISSNDDFLPQFSMGGRTAVRNPI